MSAVNYNLSIEQGADLMVSFLWQDVAGVPIDLTSYTAIAQGRVEPGAVATFFSLTQASGIVLGGTAGTIVMTIPGATTASYAGGQLGFWDMKLTSPGGSIFRFASGTVTCTEEVSV